MTVEPPHPVAPDAADPSMEEILASIRRILNDDDAPVPSVDRAEASAPDDDVLVLDESMMVPAATPAIAQAAVSEPVPAPVAGEPLPQAPAMKAESPTQAHVMEAEPPTQAPVMKAEPPTQAHVMGAEPPTQAHVMEAEPSAQTHAMEAMTSISEADFSRLPAPTPELLAPAAAAAATSAVGSLVRTLAAGRATHVYAGGPTLEDMVRAELRPLLKEWLDVNLPPMVERLVRLEIERVVGHVVP